MSLFVKLIDCPPGLFWFEGSLCFRSEYSTTVSSSPYPQPDAYVVASGEYFWGGAKSSEARSELMVQPIHYEAAVAAINGDEE